MAYNGYGGYYNSYPQFNNPIGYQQFQQPMMQQQMMNGQQQNNDIPFSEMHFGTMKEAEAHIVPPMKSVVFFNRGLGEIYIKSADNMGNPLLETFKKVGIDNKSSETVTTEFNPKEYARTSDLDGVVRKDDLKDYLTIADVQQFSTKQDFQMVASKLNALETDIKKLNRLTELLGGGNDGK